MNIQFSTISKKIIFSSKIGTITILLSKKRLINLLNINLILECKSNITSLSQLKKTRFTYHNKSTKMTAMKKSIIVTHVRYDHNFFILDLLKLSQTIAVGY